MRVLRFESSFEEGLVCKKKGHFSELYITESKGKKECDRCPDMGWGVKNVEK